MTVGEMQRFYYGDGYKMSSDLPAVSSHGEFTEG